MQPFSFAIAVLASAANTQSAPQPAACTGPEYSQMDFWVGDWQLKWDGGQGTNHITKDYGGCVIEEHFDSQPAMNLQGHSVSILSNGHWRQNWVDNEGSYFDLVGGPQTDGNFVLENVRANDKTPYRRMMFENIKPDSLTWHWQGSDDQGKTWKDRWVIEYTRVKG